MAIPSAKTIYEAAEQTIYDLIVGGKQSATMSGRSYTVHDLSKLREISDYYRKVAIQNGEIEVETTEVVPTISYARCVDF